MSHSAPEPSITIPWGALGGAPIEQLRQSIDAIVQGASTKFAWQIKVRDDEITRLRFDLRLREEQLRLALLDKYGPKSEKLSPDQILLLDLEPGVSAAEVAKEAALPEADKQLNTPATTEAATRDKTNEASKDKGPRYIKAHPGRHALPPDLERRYVLIPCLEGGTGEVIGYDEKEELVIKPAEFYVNVIKREPTHPAGAEIDSEARAARRVKAA